MTYYVEPTDRENLPPGKDWLFLEEPNGDCRFVVASDVGKFVLCTHALQVIAEALARAECYDAEAVVDRTG